MGEGNSLQDRSEAIVVVNILLRQELAFTGVSQSFGNRKRRLRNVFGNWSGRVSSRTRRVGPTGRVDGSDGAYTNDTVQLGERRTGPIHPCHVFGGEVNSSPV
jgi:hypothetical protein